MPFPDLGTVHTFWTTEIRQMPKCTNETGLLAVVLSEEVFRIVPGRTGESAGFFWKQALTSFHYSYFKSSSDTDLLGPTELFGNENRTVNTFLQSSILW